MTYHYLGWKFVFAENVVLVAVYLRWRGLESEDNRNRQERIVKLLANLEDVNVISRVALA